MKIPGIGIPAILYWYYHQFGITTFNLAIRSGGIHQREYQRKSSLKINDIVYFIIEVKKSQKNTIIDSFMKQYFNNQAIVF